MPDRCQIGEGRRGLDYTEQKAQWVLDASLMCGGV